MADFRVTRDGTTVEDAVYDVDPLVDTSNPFGNYVVVKIDDRGGSKFQQYERGTRIDVGVTPDPDPLTIQSGETVTTASGTTDTYTDVQNAGTYQNAGTVQTQDTVVERFTGYVVERRGTEQGGADALEVEAYSFDQFLRRNTVTNDQRGNTISQALADIIQTDTPVSYVASNVTVGDEQELSRSYQGEAVENVLRDLAFKSNNENFGVNDSLEFFFRPRETEHIDRGVDNTQWFNYDIPELGKEAINEVEVWFDDGNESVIVDDGTDKLDLQDSLNLPDPGTQRHELNRPLIADIGDAEDIGRKYLTFRNATLSGTVTTFGLFDAEPGDTIDITIEPRGIDTEFVIAGMEYRWGVDQTILTIVEKRGDVDDILSELNDSVQRVEMNGANRDAPSNRITTSNATAIVDLSIDADGNTPDANRFVNDGRRAVRDGWTGDTPPDIATLVVGSDGSGLSRSNTALRAQTNSASVTQSLPDSTSVQFSASITQTGVEELGLETAGGTLIMRATFDTAVDLAGTVTVTLTVSNDDSVSRGVLTTAGQTTVRDVLADNSPSVPNEYAYGSGNTPVSEADTSLVSEVVTQNLEQALIEYAASASAWDSIIDQSALPDTAILDGGTLRRAQSGWIAEAEDNRFIQETVVSDSAASDGEAVELAEDADTSSNSVADQLIFTFTNEYEIQNPVMYLRWRSNGTPPIIKGYIDDTEADAVWDSAPLSYGWTGKQHGTTLDPGEHEVRFVTANDSPSTDPAVVDLMYVYDSDEFVPTFDDEVNNPGGYLDGPERYSNLAEVDFLPTSTRRELTSATARQTWNNTENAQFIELSNDGGSTFDRTNNNDTATGLFASPSREVLVRVGLSRFGQSGATPLQGANGQEVTVHDLRADVAAVTPEDIGTTLTRAVIPPNTITGETIREAGIKSTGTLLTRHILAEFDVLQDQRLASSEETKFTGDE